LRKASLGLFFRLLTFTDSIPILRGKMRWEPA
jgi:hypothetical protein